MYVCMYVCACMYACMYVCMYVDTDGNERGFRSKLATSQQKIDKICARISERTPPNERHKKAQKWVGRKLHETCSKSKKSTENLPLLEE